MSSKAGHVPEHLTRRKDQSLLALIVPHSAETRNPALLNQPLLRIHFRHTFARLRGSSIRHRNERWKSDSPAIYSVPKNTIE